jgi:hypothetical protein
MEEGQEGVHDGAWGREGGRARWELFSAKREARKEGGREGGREEGSTLVPVTAGKGWQAAKIVIGPIPPPSLLLLLLLLLLLPPISSWNSRMAACMGVSFGLRWPPGLTREREGGREGEVRVALLKTQLQQGLQEGEKVGKGSERKGRGLLACIYIHTHTHAPPPQTHPTHTHPFFTYKETWPLCVLTVDVRI